MDQIQAGDQIVRYHREKTIAAYSTMKSGDADRCGCSSCLNFAAQRRTAFSEDFLRLLHQLGIDPQKEGEAYECGPEGDLTVYGGWFYFVGALVQPGEQLTTDSVSGLQYWFADAKRLPKPAVDFGDNVLAVKFVTRLPWVISQSS